MGRAAVLAGKRLLLPLAAVALAAGIASAAEPRFGVRAVKLGGDPADRAVREHVRWARGAGFNALFVYEHDAGRWWEERRGPPRLTRAFRSLARASRADGTRLLVSVNPEAAAGGHYVYSDERSLARLARFARLLHEAGVADLVLSFDDQRRTLLELRDVVRYGTGAAPAHLDLTARLAARLPRGMRLWLCAAAYADVHLGDGSGPYSRALLEGLPSLPPGVGMVWTGPEVISPSITREDLRRTRARLGGRPLLLYDNLHTSQGGWRDDLAAVLRPLRGRDPDLAAEAEVYLACPMMELGASRLALATTADWLRDPGAYEADASWARAIAALAGPSPAVREALAAQAREWGAAPGAPDDPFHARPDAAAEGLGDPAARARWRHVVETYPTRLALLAGAADAEFAWELTDIMRRTLTVARAWLALDAGDRAAVSALWSEAQGTPARALLAFLRAAGASP